MDNASLPTNFAGKGSAVAMAAVLQLISRFAVIDFVDFARRVFKARDVNAKHVTEPPSALLVSGQTTCSMLNGN
jgi:hypothetical protein